LRHYVLTAVGRKLPSEQVEGWTNAVLAALDELGAAVDVIDSGFADASLELLRPATTDNDLLRTVQAECRNPIHRATLRTENRGFRELAQSAAVGQQAHPPLAAIVTLLS
jgi:hypothetical protein